MMNNDNERLASYISASEGIISSDAIEEVRHFYEHGEYEMSFEGLVIELMKVRKYPNNFNLNEWRELAISYGLNKETVFDGEFWVKFINWGVLFENR